MWGPSGCGKSTLLSALLGFVKPESGEISIDGLVMGPETVDRIRRRIAWLPQETALRFEDARALFYYPYTFRQNRHLMPGKGSAAAMLERLGLSPDILGKGIVELSGGEKQRLVAASLLLLKRKILLLDEPSAALDSRSARLLMETVAKLEDTAVLVAAHDPEWRGRFAQNIPIGESMGKNGRLARRKRKS